MYAHRTNCCSLARFPSLPSPNGAEAARRPCQLVVPALGARPMAISGFGRAERRGRSVNLCNNNNISTLNLFNIKRNELDKIFKLN